MINQLLALVFGVAAPWSTLYEKLRESLSVNWSSALSVNSNKQTDRHLVFSAGVDGD